MCLSTLGYSHMGNDQYNSTLQSYLEQDIMGSNTGCRHMHKICLFISNHVVLPAYNFWLKSKFSIKYIFDNMNECVIMINST